VIVLTKVIFIFLTIFTSFISQAEESTSGPKEITHLYLNGAINTHFYLTDGCPLGKSYYVLKPERVDVDRYYSTIMAAFYAGKKVEVKYEANGVFCEVVRIFVPK
jgi:hypothetical protein